MAKRTDTILRMFLNRVAVSSDQTAIQFKRGDEFRTKTWNELAADVACIAAGLVSVGVRPGDCVAQLSENRYEWIVVDLAIQTVRAIHVPIHAPLAAAQVAYQINHSGTRVVLVSSAEQMQKLATVAESLPGDLCVVMYEAAERQVPPPHIQFSEWLQRDANEGQRLFQAAAAAGSEGELATILYTSGTTGEPKGVMLTQKNLVTNTQAMVQQFEMDDGDLRLCFLPLSHVFARTCDLYTWIASGSELALAESRETVMADCAQIRPTLINGVPYFFDRLYRGLKQAGADQMPGTLQQLLGGRIKHCCSGGAALPDHIFDFFTTQQVKILQGYGLTETSPVISMSTPTEFRRGASGKAIRDIEVKIGDDGEILTRGPHVMVGYWQDDAATAEAIRDGWFHTGDLGHVDEDGFVWITGRKKELIVTAAGKNVSPVLLESLLTQDPLIEQALVVGDGRNYLTALIVPNLELLHERLPSVRFAADDPDSLRQAEIEGLFADCIEQRLTDVSYHEQIRRFAVLHRPFAIEKGEMTPKLSLRRPIIAGHFTEEIERLYRDEA